MRNQGSILFRQEEKLTKTLCKFLLIWVLKLINKFDITSENWIIHKLFERLEPHNLFETNPPWHYPVSYVYFSLLFNVKWYQKRTVLF